MTFYFDYSQFVTIIGAILVYGSIRYFALDRMMGEKVYKNLPTLEEMSEIEKVIIDNLTLVEEEMRAMANSLSILIQKMRDRHRYKQAKDKNINSKGST